MGPDGYYMFTKKSFKFILFTLKPFSAPLLYLGAIYLTLTMGSNIEQENKNNSVLLPNVTNILKEA